MFVRKKYFENKDVSSPDLIPTSILGLLALLLGFTFSMAISRFEHRNILVVQEANAIGTAFLRAQTLPEPYDQRLSGMLRDYLHDRMKNMETFSGIYDDSPDTLKLENQMWKETRTLVREKNVLAVSNFVLALNPVFDLRSEVVFAAQNHVPEAVYYLLLMIAFIGVGFLSYSKSDNGTRQKSSYVLAVLFSLVIVFIMDLDRPGRGIIRVENVSLVRLYQSIN